MADVWLERWAERDAGLLAELNGDPEQMAHVGGAETAEKIAERQGRYVADPGQFVVVHEGQRVGWVGFWAREWRGEDVFEVGWSIRRDAQGRGLATAATKLVLEEARNAGGASAVHAFPGVENVASNRVCERTGFTLVEANLEFEYPPGTLMRCNDWRFAP